MAGPHTQDGTRGERYRIFKQFFIFGEGSEKPESLSVPRVRALVGTGACLSPDHGSVREQCVREIHHAQCDCEQAKASGTGVCQTVWKRQLFCAVCERVRVPDALYLLDEPEVSLSPENQTRLADLINRMARFLGCQFIISTHSPFMLGTLNAKIYNLDSGELEETRWTRLSNMRYFYEFFEKHRDEFEE